MNYAKQIVGNRQFGGARQFLPLKVNSAGVMPIIFAQAIMFLPTLFTLGKGPNEISRMFTDHQNIWYMVIYSVVVIGFTFLYTALIFNPKQIADNLKQNNGFIPGVKPGQPTADYIGSVMDKITFPGAILLAFVGILPGIAQRLGVTQGFSTFFGGTSLLIMVGVILDTLAANRNTIADASVRWLDEEWSHTGKTNDIGGSVLRELKYNKPKPGKSKLTGFCF